MLITPMALAQDSIDRVAVGWWAGLDAAGFYHVARALWEALSSLMAAPGVFLFTRLSGFYAVRSQTADAEARRFFFGGLDKLLFFSIPLAFLWWAFAGIAIAALYGPAFLLAVTSLRILVLATVWANIVNPYTFVLYALEQVERLVPVNVLRLVTYVAVLALLVPALSLEGAALARLFLILFPAWVYFRWTRQVAGVPFYRRAWTYLGGFGLMLVLHHGFAELLGALGSAEPATTVMAAALTLLGYVGYLFRVHPDTAQNFRYAAGLLSPLRLVEFVRHSGR
jgi:O-antigen/teichoic acid export membrane protein